MDLPAIHGAKLYLLIALDGYAVYPVRFASHSYGAKLYLLLALDGYAVYPVRFASYPWG
jgi:hypothetical protein